MYSPALIAKIKEAYPTDTNIHQLADTGSVWLGRYLDDDSTGGISVDEILLATSLEEIQKKARNLKIRKQVYAMWCDEDPRRKGF